MRIVEFQIKKKRKTREGTAFARFSLLFYLELRRFCLRRDACVCNNAIETDLADVGD